MLKHLLALLLVLSPAAALARPWMGVTPGESSRSDVLGRFGEPTRKVRQGEKEILAYTAEQAIKGTTQAQFTILGNGKLEQIVVFPATVLEMGEIEDTYGPACSSLAKAEQARGACYTKQLTDDFRTYYWYKRLGLVVFFNEDKKTVHSILFNSPVSASATAVLQ